VSNTFAGCLIFTRPTDGIPRDARAVEVTVIHYDLMRNCTEATRVVIRASPTWESILGYHAGIGRSSARVKYTGGVTISAFPGYPV